MGNCQAIDAAALVIQHPDGRIERLYWSLPATEVMRMNPGHYVSLIIPLPAADDGEDDSSHNNKGGQKKVQFTRVKLLRPSETLTLGHAYRLITSQEVMKVLRAKKYAKMKQQRHPHPLLQPDEGSQLVPHKLQDETSCQTEGETSDTGKSNQNQEMRHERNRGRTASINSGAARSKSWRPTLQSIEEVAS